MRISKAHVWFAAIAAVALVAAGSAWAQTDTIASVKQKGKLVVGVKADYKPFGYTDPSGKIVGLEVDLSRHGAREELAGRHHGAGRQRLLEPGSDELDFVVDRSERLLGETQRRLNRHDGLSRMTHRPLGHGMVTILSRVKALESRVK